MQMLWTPGSVQAQSFGCGADAAVSVAARPLDSGEQRASCRFDVRNRLVKLNAVHEQPDAGPDDVVGLRQRLAGGIH